MMEPSTYNVFACARTHVRTSENSVLNVIGGEDEATNVVGDGFEEMLDLEDRVGKLFLLHQAVNS